MQQHLLSMLYLALSSLSEKRKIHVRAEIRLYHIHSEHHVVILYFINTTSPGTPRLTLAERALQIAILNCNGQLYHFLFLNLVYGRDTLHSALMAVGAASFKQCINMFLFFLMLMWHISSLLVTAQIYGW